MDDILRKIINEHMQASRSDVDPKRAMGMVLKAFYSQIEKSNVDTQMIKQRALILLAGQQ